MKKRRPGRGTRVGSAGASWSRRFSRLEMKNALGIHQVVFIRMLYFLGSNGSCLLPLARDRRSLILLIEP